VQDHLLVAFQFTAEYPLKPPSVRVLYVATTTVEHPLRMDVLYVLTDMRVRVQVPARGAEND
jgi:hypothetical protein